MTWWSWFGTYTGRQFLQGTAMVTSVATFAGFHLPQSLLLEKYKEIVQSYEKGLGQPVPPKPKLLYEDVLRDLKVPQWEKELLDVFTVFGFDLFNAGSTSLRTGALIGIPINFSYEKEQDVSRKIRVANKLVDWETKAGESLRRSLLLSEDARRFGLAREVTSARSLVVWSCGLYPSGAILLTYLIARTLNNRLYLRQHPFRYIMYGLVATFNLALYITLKDLTNAYQEASSDETAASISPAYAKGGIEFYQKMLKRNKALRELMGENGQKLYTVTGNDVMILRMKTTPLTDRLRFIEELSESEKKY